MTEQFYGYNVFAKGFYYDDGESCVPFSNEDIVNQLNKFMKRNWELIDEKEDLKGINSQLEIVNLEGRKQVEKLARENEQLKQENRLLKGRIEEYIEQLNDSTKSRNDKEKSCGYCKNYNLDGMFGIWCSIHETPTSNKYCQDFEWNR